MAINARFLRTITKCEMTLEIFHWKGIDLLGIDGEDTLDDREASTDDTDKLNKYKCSENNWVTSNLYLRLWTVRRLGVKWRLAG